MSQKTCLIVIDGWGIGPKIPSNAIHAANTPIVDSLSKSNSYTELKASGLAVGLPEGVMGNSEVGHLTIGAGRPLRTDVVRINQAISANSLQNMPEIKTLKQHYLANKSPIHFIGLMSDASVHSNINHLFSILSSIIPTQDSNPNTKNRTPIYLHLITDGRDTPPKSSLKYLAQVQEFINNNNNNNTKIEIATLGGRFFYMDRDNRKERIDQAVNTMLNKNTTNLTPREYIESNHNNNITDEFIPPVLFNSSYSVSSNDILFFFNFRPDRMREIVTAFSDIPCHKDSIFGLTEYSSSFTNVKTLFKPIFLSNCLVHILSENNFEQYHIAETEKYAHVTYFFNGRDEAEIKGEERVLVESNKSVKTYDLAPEMRMEEVANKAIEIICREEQGEENKFVVLNFAGPDMVGHTGELEAAIKAVEVCDREIGRVMEACDGKGWNFVVTSDHGNAEVMKCEETGNKVTSHTSNRVLFCVKWRNEELKWDSGRRDGSLADVAPTILKMMGIDSSHASDMEGVSFLQ